MLQLNAFLLRQGISPVRAISTASLPDTSFALWTNNRLEPLEVADGDLLDAAVPGDVIVAWCAGPLPRPRGNNSSRMLWRFPTSGEPHLPLVRSSSAPWATAPRLAGQPDG